MKNMGLCPSMYCRIHQSKIKKGLNFVLCIQCEINKAKNYSFTLLAKVWVCGKPSKDFLCYLLLLLQGESIQTSYYLSK